MCPLILFLLLVSSHSILGKNNVRALTQDLGQEVIEIGTPIKELPADIEEEPSIENEEDEHSTTSTAVTSRLTTTKREPKKTSIAHAPVATLHPKKLPLLENTEDEEDRIEKELAEIYKDNVADYKESSESSKKAVTKETPTTVTSNTNSTEELTKPIARAGEKDNFKFQPDPFNKAEIERFRTSVDDISCIKKLRQEGKTKTDAGCTTTLNILVSIPCLIMMTLF